MLCEISENHAEIMHQMYGFNTSHCNSAISLSGCIERKKSKVIIALSTNGDVVQLFEKTLINGFIYVSTRVGFDTKS